MTVVVAIAYGMIVVAAALLLWRVVRADSLADRAVALDAITACLVSGVAISIVADGDGLPAEVALVLGLLGFLATVAIARFVGRRQR